MGKADWLCEEKLNEEYEDLLFKKVMAVYAEKESEKINLEKKEGNFEKPKQNFEKLLKKSKRKKAKVFILSGIKKLAAFAAAVIFVAVVSIASVIVVPAEMQEDIRKFFAPTVYDITHNSVDISTEKTENDGFIDKEIYTMENAFVPTWLPEGYVLSSSEGVRGMLHIRYVNGEKEIMIMEYSYSENRNYHMDYDKGDIVEDITIDGNEGIIVTEEGGEESAIFLRCGETDFFVYADESKDVTMKIAENMKKLPASDNIDEDKSPYGRIDGAYVPTFVPDEFYMRSVETDEKSLQVNYRFENEFFFVIESTEKPEFPFDEEKAEYRKIKNINGFSGEFIGNIQYNCVRFGTEELWIMIYGNIEERTIRKIANNMEPMG